VAEATAKARRNRAFMSIILRRRAPLPGSTCVRESDNPTPRDFMLGLHGDRTIRAVTFSPYEADEAHAALHHRGMCLRWVLRGVRGRQVRLLHDVGLPHDGWAGGRGVLSRPSGVSRKSAVTEPGDAQGPKKCRFTGDFSSFADRNRGPPRQNVTSMG